MKFLKLFIFCLYFPASLIYSQQSKKQKPNIIIILADDLGYGDLGIYGGDVASPNLQKLKQEGLLFTDFHSNGAVCSPTRAALLTGRYQQRMGIEKALGENEKGFGDEKARHEITVAKYLQQAGYYTGIVGKWHLGYGEDENPVNYGFNEFWGTLHGAGDYISRVNTFGRYDWWHNKELLWEEGYSTHLITRHSTKFIEAHKDHPFFLFVSHKAIHFPWQQPGDTAHRSVGSKYRDVTGPLSRLGQHSPGEVKEVVRQMITEMDKSVGEIISKLRETKLDKNTLVIFCSDNGGITAYRGGYINISSNKPLRGAKSNLYEGGHRVPAIAWWPGRISSGTITEETVMSMDITPTLLELAGVQRPSDQSINKLDGISISPLLFKIQPLRPRKLFWKHGDSYAVRFGDWKLVTNDANTKLELYNLKDDIAETKNLAGQKTGVVNELISAMEKWKRDIYSKPGM